MRKKFAVTLHQRRSPTQIPDLLAGLALEEQLAVLVELDLGDHDLGRADRLQGSLAITLVTLDALDVNDPLLAENTGHLYESSFFSQYLNQD